MRDAWNVRKSAHGVVAEGVERVPGALHQQRIDLALVAPGQAAQFGRQRDEVGGRHQRWKLALR